VTLNTVEIGLEGLDVLESESLCLFIGQDERPLTGTPGFADWRLNGGLSRRLLEEFFSGTFKETLLLPSRGLIPPKRIFVIGAGPLAQLDPGKMGELLETAAQMLKKAGAESVALSLPPLTGLDDQARAELVRTRFLSHFGQKGVTVLAERGLKAALA
jgi:hypothetical protein